MASVHPQAAGTPSTPTALAKRSSEDLAPDCLGGTVKSIKYQLGQSNENARRLAKNELTRWAVYVCQFTADPIRAKLLALAEQKRQDKQPGASSNSSGSTSLVSKGSSPWLLGFALEHGGLTQTTDGNTITFRGNVVNSISALLKATYSDSYDLSQKDSLVRYLSKLSFGVSFDPTSNQATTTQGFRPSTSNFSGFAAKYELYNHRDPRDRKWVKQWNELAGAQGAAIAQANLYLQTVITETYKDKFGQWREPLESRIDKLPPNAKDEEIRNLVQTAADTFHQKFWDLPEVKDAVGKLIASMSAFVEAQDQTVDAIRGSWLVTVEYNYTRQLTTSNQMVTATEPGQRIPNLSNMNLVFEKGIQGGNTPEFTFNTGATWFNSSDSANPRRGGVRDYRASLELDVPLKEIQNVGRPTLSFSGQFLSLLEEPLGQKVMLNGVTIDRKGNIGVFQTKVSIPVKDSGVKIPVSFTYASRTELIKEKDVRGNIGITFDLDSLFSKAK